jgi:hypothetical protein
VPPRNPSKIGVHAPFVDWRSRPSRHRFTLNQPEMDKDMAKKNSTARKAEFSESEVDVTPVMSDAVENESSPGVPDESSPAKPKTKVKEDPGSSATVGISDIRKAAAFANSVGGLDKALALLQILKVAKEVQ